MNGGGIVLSVLAALACWPVAAETRVAVLRGLDKVTARIFTIEAPVEGVVDFGTLRIAARYCRERPPEQPPETTAFLEIDELRQRRPPKRVFSGWMFASSPALSSLEHPVYDVWVVGCRTAASAEEGSSR